MAYALVTPHACGNGVVEGEDEEDPPGESDWRRDAPLKRARGMTKPPTRPKKAIL